MSPLCGWVVLCRAFRVDEMTPERNPRSSPYSWLPAGDSFDMARSLATITNDKRWDYCKKRDWLWGVFSVASLTAV
jgi:hypothetical protein